MLQKIFFVLTTLFKKLEQKNLLMNIGIYTQFLGFGLICGNF